MRTPAILAVAALSALFVCAGCGSAPRVPEWNTIAASAIEGFERHYLAGNTRLADRDLNVARSAVASTGRLSLAARVEAIRCAVATASLDFDRCTTLDAVLADAAPEERAYAAFLRGEWEKSGTRDEIDARLLPANYRGIVGASDAEAQNRAMQAIDDPLSRLVTAGVLLRLGRVSPDGVAIAVETAAAEGWRRPLLAWLGVQAKLAEAAGDQAALATIRKRIDLASGTARAGNQP